MQDQPPRPSLWERLGQGVSQAWEKTKEVSGQLGEFASLKLDIRSARDHLESRYRLLGRIAAERIIDRGETKVEAEEPVVKTVLDEITATRERLAALEKKLAESRQEDSGSGTGSESGSESGSGSGTGTGGG